MEKRTTNLARSLSKLLIVGMILAPVAWGQEGERLDPDRVNIARMRVDQLALSILSVRTDLKQYLTHDLSTTSGQYELLYDETMGPCKRRKDHTQPYELCTGTSLNVSFFGYLKSNQRVCPDPETGSCWKPALTEHQMREELFDLVRTLRGAHAKKTTLLIPVEDAGAIVTE